MSLKYVGQELDVFAQAKNWKRYVRRQVEPFIKGDVLEVGAGQGGTTQAFFHQAVTRWICLEPDRALAQKIVLPDPTRCEVIVGTLKGLEPSKQFDAILYIDVLEHIENAEEEIKLAVSHLKVGGHLIILAPAHNFLFTPFDQAVGHFRRYDKQMLEKLKVNVLRKVVVKYLDSGGCILSLTNKFFLKSSQPTLAQIRFWDNVVIPISKFVDPIFFYNVGKSILAVWRRDQ